MAGNSETLSNAGVMNPILILSRFPFIEKHVKACMGHPWYGSVKWYCILGLINWLVVKAGKFTKGTL